MSFEKMVSIAGKLFPNANQQELKRLARAQMRYSCTTCPREKTAILPSLYHAIWDAGASSQVAST